MTSDDSDAARLCVTDATGGTGKTTAAINVDPAEITAPHGVDSPSKTLAAVEQTNEDQMLLGWLEEVFAYEQSVDMEDVFLDIATELDRTFGYTKVTA